MAPFAGLVMILDTLQERGLASADIRWGDEEQCRFPLFDSLRPLPLPWMVVLYLCMSIGMVAFGIFIAEHAKGTGT